MVLATKGRFAMGDGRNDSGLSRRHLRDALDASLRRLGVDHVDLYQVHAFDPLTPLEETFRFLDDAVRAGKVAYVGLSNYAGWQIQKAVDLCERLGLRRAGHAAAAVQPARRARSSGRSCRRAGPPASGLLPWSPLGGGWLTGKYTREERPTGATRLGEDPERGVEAYDRRCGSERTWDVIDAVAGDRVRARRLDGAGRAGVAARPAVDDVGDPGRAHARAVATTTSAPRGCT